MMLIATSSRRIRRRFPDARTRLVAVAFCALAIMWSATPHAFAHFSEENLPAQDMPQDMPSGGATPDNGAAADWVQVPAGALTNATPAAPVPGPSSAGNSPASSTLPGDTNAAQVPSTPMAAPTDIAPLEVGSVAPQMQISDSSLDDLIRKVSQHNQRSRRRFA